MAQAKSGDTLRVHYTGRLEDGTTFDTSIGRDPLEFTLGEGRLIPGFELGVRGMAPGETRTITVEPADAYGERRAELVLTVDPGSLPPGLDPKPGDRLEMEQGGQTFLVTVTEVTDDGVTLDANHPLAGHTLSFEIELLEIL